MYEKQSDVDENSIQICRNIKIFRVRYFNISSIRVYTYERRWHIAYRHDKWYSVLENWQKYTLWLEHSTKLLAPC